MSGVAVVGGNTVKNVTASRVRMSVATASGGGSARQIKVKRRTKNEREK